MPSKLQFYTQMADHTAGQITGSFTFIFHSGGIYSTIGKNMRAISTAENPIIVTGFRSADGVFDGGSL